MRSNGWTIVLLASITSWACGEPDTKALLAPSLAQIHDGRQTIVVDPNANGNGIANTIQEGIDRVESGGSVLITGGVYNEAIVIDKGLTLTAIGDGAGPVVLAPSGTPASVIAIVTTEPVLLHQLTVHSPGLAGINGVGAVDLTVDEATVVAVNPSGGSNLIFVAHDAADGTRARMVVRNSFIDGTITGQVPPLPQLFALRAQGDVDALFTNNVVRRTGGACIFVVTRADLGGATNVDIVNNDIDECHPTGRVAGIIVGPLATNLPTPTRPVTATGVVNIVGNLIRNSSGSCLPASAIAFEVGSGRIEHNRIINVVQPCAVPTGRNLQAAIWAGRRQHPLFPPVGLVVRFNDFVGNAFAGLRVGANQATVVDAACNYWGSADGPSGVGPGTGDAVLVETGAAMPTLTPFATSPVAGSRTGC